MYAMDRAVHTEHSSASRRGRREVWRLRRSTPTPSASVPDDGDDSVFVPADAADFAD